MAIQIRGSSQIISASISADRLNLSDTFDFSSGILRAASPSASSDVATKAYVDSLVPDGFQAGNGISIDTGTSPDTVSVLTAADGALQFIGVGSNELSVKLDGSTLSKSGTGVKVADGGIADAQIAAGASIAISKLAASTISGVSLGSNLFGLSASGVLSMSSYDGSAAVSDLQLNYDAAMFDNSAGSLIIKDNAVTTAKIAAAAVTQAKLANDSVGSAQIINASVGTDELALAAVTTAKIANLAVATGQIQDAAITSVKLALNSVATGNIQGGAVTQAKLANDSVGSAQIINASVGTDELAAASVTQAKLANDSVGSAQIIDGSVGGNELANNSIQMAKLSFSSYWNSLTPNSSSTAFDLSKALQAACQQIFVVKNGLVMKQVASSPSGSDEYTVSLNGGTAGVGQITFGSAPQTGDDLRVWFMANN